MWFPVTSLGRASLLRSVYLGHARVARRLPVTLRASRCFSCTNAVRVKEARKPYEEEEPPLNPPQSLAGTEGLYKADPGSVEATPHSKSDIDPLQDKSIGLFQRFKKTFKQYGKVMVPVHIATSTVWFGSFYYAAMK